MATDGEHDRGDVEDVGVVDPGDQVRLVELVERVVRNAARTTIRPTIASTTPMVAASTASTRNGSWVYHRVAPPSA